MAPFTNIWSKLPWLNYHQSQPHSYCCSTLSNYNFSYNTHCYNGQGQPTWAKVLSAWWVVETGVSPNSAKHMPQLLFPQKHQSSSAELHQSMFLDDITSCHAVPITLTGVLHCLTHWGRVTHICIGNLITIGSDNGLSPGRCQAIIWINAEIHCNLSPWEQTSVKF